MCAVLSEHGAMIAASTYYDARARIANAQGGRDEKLKEQIAQVHRDNYGVYGARKVWWELNRQGIPVARCTVERLMVSAYDLIYRAVYGLMCRGCGVL